MKVGCVSFSEAEASPGPSLLLTPRAPRQLSVLGSTAAVLRVLPARVIDPRP
jgi:hypothetical protein